MRHLIITLFCLTSFACTKAPLPPNIHGDYVVLLHGIARSSSHMESLETHLHHQGFDVINLDYPSTKHDLQTLIQGVHEDLSTRLVLDKPTHFVGYSMGGLLVHAIAHKYPPQNRARVVQLAPPNHGSEVADFIQNNWLYKKIYGPAGQQLTTDTDLSNLLGEVSYELGIIAGSRSIDPISSFILPGRDDGKVTIASSKLDGMKDHIIVAATHTFFPSNKSVHLQTSHFLKHGTFQEHKNK